MVVVPIAVCLVANTVIGPALSTETSMPSVRPQNLFLACPLLLIAGWGGLALRVVIAQEQSPSLRTKLVVRTSDGDEYPAVLQAFAGRQARIMRDGVGQDVDISGLSFVRFPEHDVTDEQPSTGDYEVLLRDGSQCRVRLITSDGESFRLEAETWKLDLEPSHVASIRFSELTDQQQAAWLGYRDAAANSDLLVVKQPTGALTKIDGIVLGITPAAINFEFGGTQLPVPYERLAGVRFFSSSNTRSGNAVGIAQDVYGNRWMFTEIESENAFSTPPEAVGKPGLAAEVDLQLVCGASLRLPIRDLVAIDFGSGSQKSITELELVRKSAEDAFDFGKAGIDISSLFGVRTVSSGQRSFNENRLEFLGSGDAVYMVPQEFTRFVGSVKLEPQGNRFTACTVEIFLERDLLWSEQLSSPGQSMGFDLPVSGDKRLRLVVRANSSIPTGTVVVWSEPTLLK